MRNATKISNALEIMLTYFVIKRLPVECHIFPQGPDPELLHKMSGCHVVFSDSLSRGSLTPESMVSFLEIIISILLVCCMICQFDSQMLRIARFSGTIKCWRCFFCAIHLEGRKFNNVADAL